jgi:hypothetical protein
VDPDESEIATTDVSQRLRMPQREEPGVPFSEGQYDRIQRKIVGSVSSVTASLWLTACFLFVGAGIGGFITYLSLPNVPGVEDAVVRSNVLLACMACGGFAAICMVGHVAWYRQKRSQGHDLCDEMDTHCGREKAAWRREQERPWSQRFWRWLRAGRRTRATGSQQALDRAAPPHE